MTSIIISPQLDTHQRKIIEDTQMYLSRPMNIPEDLKYGFITAERARRHVMVNIAILHNDNLLLTTQNADLMRQLENALDREIKLRKNN
jgi:hypothetical protein